MIKRRRNDHLRLMEWNADDSSVYREIVARWSREDYEDVDKRTAHEKTLEEEWKAKQYSRDRAKAYTELEEQLDLLYHAIDAGKVDKTSDFYKDLKKVKDDNPK